MEQVLQLLAPAGDIETAKTALNCGADAVYVGCSSFSARAYAKNFSDDELRELIRYAHLRDKKVHVAVNTMIKDSEFDAALACIDRIYDSGADAVIVADTGLAAAAHKAHPDFRLHASTQMGIHTPEGAITAKTLGCTRVIPSRECTLSDLRAIADTGIEVEAFCHGALCSAFSGACLMSSFIGSRSGNRGSCAQPCRLKWSVGDSDSCYALSTADLCSVGFLQDLLSAGVCSLKIEGRMKRPEYAAVTVMQYRAAIDALLSGNSFDAEKARHELKKIYNRGGFTKGYFYGSRDVTYTAKNGHMGVFAGTVLRTLPGNRAEIKTDVVLQKGDGLNFADKDGLTIGYADKTDKGYIVPAVSGVKKGDKVTRTTDAAQMQTAAAAAQTDNCVISATARFFADESTASLELFAKDHSVLCSAAVTEKAANPASDEKIAALIGKTGGTVFSITDINIERSGIPHLPASLINGLRRDALSMLTEKILDAAAARSRISPRAAERSVKEHSVIKTNSLVVQAETPEQIKAAIEAGADRIIFAPLDYCYDTFSSVNGIFDNLWLLIPPFVPPKDLAVLEDLLLKFPDTFAGAYIGNISHTEFCKKHFSSFAYDFFANIANHNTVKTAEDLGASAVTISPELNSHDISLLPLSRISKELVVYGSIPLMCLPHCPVKKQGGGVCHEKCTGEVLTDRTNTSFPLRRQRISSCLLRVLNSLPLFLTDIPAVKAAGIDSLRLIFTEESPEEVKNLTKAFQLASSQNKKAQVIINKKTTTGHFSRGI